MSSIEPSEVKIKELISLFDKKQFDELLKLSNELLYNFPKSILLQNIQGVVHTELKNYKLAKDLFIKVVDLNPKYTDGYYNLANIFIKLNEEEKAIENYKEVIKLDKNYFKAHNNLGNIYRRKGLNKKAIECYLSTLEINSNYKIAYYNLAGVLQFYIINEENNFKENKNISDLEILCLSCYEPLTNFDWSNKIKFSNRLKEIFELHLNQCKIENQISNSIKSISKVKDRVSLNVKKQYEENPYPRWENIGLSIEPRNIKDVISDSDLKLDLKKITNCDSPEILIAGCGTGQHAITTASKYKKSKILALDLSFKSLSYAKRKANELGIKNIEFVQGDILDLESIDRKFDIIESVGVLHHMDNPHKGWKILTSCLNNDSLMLIGLYSEKARQHIAYIKDKIDKLKLQSSYSNIIKFRKDLIEHNNDKWNAIKSSPDFYTLSGVRDLLFHVQEHRFTISKIKKNLDELGLVFLGFDDRLVIENFRKIYNKKSNLYDLDKWQEYENYNPRIFASMYQFWCKKL